MARANTEPVDRPARRSGPSLVTLTAFVLGLPLGIGLLKYLHSGPWQETLLFRYVSHPIEWVEVVLFCCGLSALAAKVLTNLLERGACRGNWLPAWNGQPVPASEAAAMLQELRRQRGPLEKSSLGRRLASILDFVSRRGSADQLDDQLRALADNDVLAQDGSYSLIRFITWAIPILGFLGTVLGITDAVAGVTPELLEQSLSSVTSGLATAFDTTGLALALTMVLMFGSFVTDRLEQDLLERVDHIADEHLAHRFARTAGADGGAFAELLRQSTQGLLRTVEGLVERQAEIWSVALEKAEQRWQQVIYQQQQLISGALENALQRTLVSHTQQVAELDREAAQRSQALVKEIANLAHGQRQIGQDHQAVLAEMTASLASCVDALARLQQDGGQLLRLQDTLQQNLSALAGAGAFEQAVHSLTAVVHLLNARLASPASLPTRSGLGKAA